jgi:hypothetical protein
MKKIKKIYFDNIHSDKKVSEILDYGKTRINLSKSVSEGGALLYKKGRISQQFFTEDSKLYITPAEQARIDAGMILNRQTGKWDALSNRIVNEYIQSKKTKKEDMLIVKLRQKLESLQQEISDASQSVVGQFGIVKLWNLSIVGAILFGMVSMTFIYRYLGQGAAAGVAADTLNKPAIERQLAQIEETKVLGIETEKIIEQDIDSDDPDAKFKTEVTEMVKGYPIEEMLPYILEKDRKVASFLISIAKKESSWGEHVPVLNGQDCYNYWGYRGQRKLMGTGGHTCFNSRKDAVDTVAKRISTLVNEKGKNTPEKMVLWKCGDQCSSDSGAKKWVSDVNMYFKKLND